MAQRYLFFNSITGDRRKYQAQDFAQYFRSVLSSGLLHTDEVPGMKVSVEQGTLNTVVRSGQAIMRGHYYENTSNLTLNHSIPEASQDRIDRVILRLDLRNEHRNILLHVKEGTPASDPNPPELQRDDFIHEISLAQIRVRANTSSLQESDLINERLNEELCGLVNSLITLPTDEIEELMDDMEQEWRDFIADKNEEFEAASGDFEDQIEYFNNEWQDWIYNIQSDTFARVVNKQTGVVYKLVLDEDELFLEEV